MAKKVYDEKEFLLMDGTAIVVRPLPIKPLRVFMETWNGVEKLDKDATEVDLVDIMFECAYIVVEQFNDEVTKSQLEDSLDMKTMQEVLSLGGGIQTGAEEDPKATRRA